MSWLFPVLIACSSPHITKTIIAKHFHSKLSGDKEQEVVTFRNTILRKVRIYIDNNLNPTKVNVVDPATEYHSR